MEVRERIQVYEQHLYIELTVVFFPAGRTLPFMSAVANVSVLDIRSKKSFYIHVTKGKSDMSELRIWIVGDTWDMGKK